MPFSGEEHIWVFVPSQSSLTVSPGFTQAPIWASTPVGVNTGLCCHSVLLACLFIALFLQTLSFLQMETCGLNSSDSIPRAETQ